MITKYKPGATEPPISWSEPTFDRREIEEVLTSFKDNWLTMGPKVAQFEQVMATRLKVPHAIAVSSGTIALELAIQILGIRPGDEVIVPSLTHFATAASVSRLGALPVFVDIDPNTLNLDPEKLRNASSGQTKAIIFIDYGGGPARIGEIMTAAAELGIHVIQDAAQSLGGIYGGIPLGAQTEISTTSFHMAKVLTTVEGGMIFTHRDDFAAEAKIYRKHGETAKYMHSRLGPNACMTDIAASIGLVQASKLDWMLLERRRVAERYNQIFDKVPSIKRINIVKSGNAHANFFYTILIENRDLVISTLKRHGIDTRVAYPKPLYRQEVYSSGRAPCRITPSPQAEWAAERVVNLPIYPTLQDDQISKISEIVLSVV
jgi:perosamine synthetase